MNTTSPTSHSAHREQQSPVYLAEKSNFIAASPAVCCDHAPGRRRAQGGSVTPQLCSEFWCCHYHGCGVCPVWAELQGGTSGFGITISFDSKSYACSPGMPRILNAWFSEWEFCVTLVEPSLKQRMGSLSGSDHVCLSVQLLCRPLLFAQLPDTWACVCRAVCIPVELNPQLCQGRQVFHLWVASCVSMNPPPHPRPWAAQVCHLILSQSQGCKHTSNGPGGNPHHGLFLDSMSTSGSSLHGF